MDWQTYQACCDRGDVLSRYLLEQTAILLADAGEQQLAAALQAVSRRTPLPQPADHRGGPGSDFFVLELATGQAERIVALLLEARAAGARTAEGRSLGGFVEAWQEYVDWRTGVHPRSPGPVGGESG